RLDHEPFDITNIECGFTKEVVVQNFSFNLLTEFPATVKLVLQSIINNDDFFYYFHIDISSLIGIAEKERFYQPYQIWIIKKMIGTPQVFAVNEDKEHLSKTIDECYNKFDHYQVQTGIYLLSQAHYLLHDDVYKFWTDGRRILAFPNGNIQEDRDEESVKLLKKIANMELEEFPSHIIEKIKYTWETWNSPPRLSSDSLHLDEIEEMNLDNMQEG
ncbi:hypothetical protein Gotur_025708, partial [Gossypium turneri]